MAEAYKIANADCPYKDFSWFGTQYALNATYKTTLSPMWIYNFDYTMIVSK
jgi:hypothetical protein